MRFINHAAALLERAAVFIGCACLFMLMLIVTADVFLRYFMHRPLTWTHDVVTLYLMPTIFFLALSDSFRAGAQVRVDILRERLPPWFRSIADALGYVGAAIGFALIGYGGWRQGIDALKGHEVVPGSIPWPVWPSFMLVAIGSLMLVIRLLSDSVSGFTKPHESHDEAGSLRAGEIE